MVEAMENLWWPTFLISRTFFLCLMKKTNFNICFEKLWANRIIITDIKITSTGVGFFSSFQKFVSFCSTKFSPCYMKICLQILKHNRWLDDYFQNTRWKDFSMAQLPVSFLIYFWTICMSFLLSFNFRGPTFES